MSRRSAQMFNLSFLDLLSGALGAVIFLFIITPRGGEASAKIPQAIVSIDTAQQQLFGLLPDSLLHKNAGDTLLVLVSGWKEMPGTEECPPIPAPVPCPACPSCPDLPATPPVANVKPKASPKPSQSTKTKLEEVKPEEPQIVYVNTTPAKKGYQGDPPSVPCKVSFEITWEDMADNVDLFVCKDGDCVYGSRRRRSKIGHWDSGKSRNSIIGGDVRTTLEAVRQFDQPIPGTYKLYASFKHSTKKNETVRIKGLVYSRPDDAKERGERFYKVLTLDKKKRTLIGTVTLKADGTFALTK